MGLQNINTDWLLIVLVAFSVVVIKKYLFLPKGDKIAIIKSILFDLVVEAERLYGSATGKIKLNFVIKQFYNVVPKYLQRFVKIEYLEKLIEEALVEMKNYLKENEIAKKIF